MAQRLTDYDFFTKCISDDCEIAQQLKELAEKGDFEAACSAFAKYLKAFLKPEKYIKSTDMRNEQFSSNMYPGEDAIAAADRFLQNHMISCGIPYKFEGDILWKHNPTPDHYREWTWQIQRHYEFYFLAIAYLKTGDERYAEHYVKTILGWIDAAPVPENEPGGATECWRTIEAGIRMVNNWHYCIHAFIDSPAVTDRVITTIFKSVWEHGWRLRNFCTTCNWLIMEMAGLGHIGLLYPFLNGADEWLNYAVMRLEREGDAQPYPDGFQFELSTNYHHVLILNYFWLLDSFRRMEVNPPEKLLKVFSRLCDVYTVLVGPDMRLPDLNDGKRLDMTDGLYEAIKLLPDREDLRWLYTKRKEGRPPEFLSKVLDWSGVAIMRSDWSENALWFMHEAAPFGMGHQHEDKNGVELQAYGKPFITEAGANAYDASVRHNYALSTFGHNTMLVDSFGQNRRTKYRRTYECVKTKSGIGFYSCDDFDVSQGKYDEGYGPEYIPVTHLRRVLFLKNPQFADPFFVVIDRAVNNDIQPHTYETLWHFEDEHYDFSPDDKTFKLSYTDGPSLAVFTPNADSVKVVRAQTEPTFQGFKASWNVDDVLPMPTVIATKTSSSPCRSVTVLYPSKDNTVKLCKVESGDAFNDTSVTLYFDDQTVTIDENDYFKNLEF